MGAPYPKAAKAQSQRVAQAPRRTLLYAGEVLGREHLASLGITAGSYHVDASASNAVLVIGPGGGREVLAANGNVTRWLEDGGSLLALGLDQAEARSALGLDITMSRQEYISTSFDPFGVDTLFAGIGPADLHNRDPRDLPLVTGGVQVIGDGVLSRVFGREAGSTPLLPRFRYAAGSDQPAPPWVDSFYLDQPEEWDDPYRFFRW